MPEADSTSVAQALADGSLKMSHDLNLVVRAYAGYDEARGLDPDLP
jgi:hypothetical protein